LVCTKTLVACSDSAIATLDLKTTVSPGQITNTADGTGWQSTIDATAGGFNPTQSYVYARFTAAGLAKVALSDQAAIDSMDWDIAFRRFVLRLNGGDSGPACTGAVALADGGTYHAITAPPRGATWVVDNYLDEPPACTFLPDGSGLTTSPQTALATFYSYATCVAMTGRPFVIRTSANRHLKLVVDTYYSTEAGQTTCNSAGNTGGALGGTIRLRWAYLD
jgi:hypothetical protein